MENMTFEINFEECKSLHNEVSASMYNKLLEENKALKECITIITNEQLRTAFKIKDLMKEIKKLQEQTRWTEEGLDEWSRYQSILNILKKIEENK